MRATAIDAIVAAYAAERTGIVYTSDVADFRALHILSDTARVRDLRLRPMSNDTCGRLAAARGYDNAVFSARFDSARASTAVARASQ